MFLTWTLMRCGPDPAVPPPVLAPNAPPLEGRGGAIETVDDVDDVVMQLDGLLTLLELAGYQTRELAIALPTSDGTLPDAAVHLDLLTSLVDGQGRHDWPAPFGGTGAGGVGLWVEPRSNASSPFYGGAVSPPVEFSGSGAGVGFGPQAPGWLDVVIDDSDGERSWSEQLAAALPPVMAELTATFVDAFNTAPQDPDGVPLCGLMGILHPATWLPGDGDPGFWGSLGGSLQTVAQTVYDDLLGPFGAGIGTFLEQEVVAGSPAEDLSPYAGMISGLAMALQPAPPPLLTPAPPVTVGELFYMTWSQVVMQLAQSECIDVLSYFGDPPVLLPQLQADLRTLGFAMVDGAEPLQADKPVGITTEWAIRELQVYAQIDRVARVDEDTTPIADGYAQAEVPTSWLRKEVPTGRVDRQTVMTLWRWLASGWRCPVVIEAWIMGAKGRSALAHDNIWRHDEVLKPPPKQPTPHMFACDFTGYWDASGHQAVAGEEIKTAHTRFAVGHYYPYDVYGGPVSLPKSQETWSEDEVVFDEMGVIYDPNALSAELISTFIAVRTVSERECIGHFDCITAYDRSFVSLGPCHWTLGLVSHDKKPTDPPQMHMVNEDETGELPAMFAYLRWKDPDAFFKALEFFGLRPIDAWDDGGKPDGQTMTSDQHKYVGWLERPGPDGKWAALPDGPQPAEQIANAYKGWHWVYRFQMAGRTIPAWRTACWDFARLRIRDVRSTPWGTVTRGRKANPRKNIPADPNAYPGIPNFPDGRAVTIGDVYTSARAAALLHRWHVYTPGDVVSKNLSGDDLRAAYRHATDALPGVWNTPPDTWDDAHETALINGILARAAEIGGDLNDAITGVDQWPKNFDTSIYHLDPAILGPVAETRNSFAFYDAVTLASGEPGVLPPQPDFSIAKRH